MLPEDECVLCTRIEVGGSLALTFHSSQFTALLLPKTVSSFSISSCFTNFDLFRFVCLLYAFVFLAAGFLRESRRHPDGVKYQAPIIYFSPTCLQLPDSWMATSRNILRPLRLVYQRSISRSLWMQWKWAHTEEGRGSAPWPHYTAGPPAQGFIRRGQEKNWEVRHLNPLTIKSSFPGTRNPQSCSFTF